MSENTPKSGQHPYGGENNPGDGLPGEVPENDTQQAPQSAQRTDDDTASRAATEGEMSSPEQGAEPSEGIPEQVHAPGPEDATESNAPGGSARNQSGRTPDQYGDPTHSIS